MNDERTNIHSVVEVNITEIRRRACIAQLESGVKRRVLLEEAASLAEGLCSILKYEAMREKEREVSVCKI